MELFSRLLDLILDLQEHLPVSLSWMLSLLLVPMAMVYFAGECFLGIAVSLLAFGLALILLPTQAGASTVLLIAALTVWQLWREFRLHQRLKALEEWRESQMVYYYLDENGEEVICD